MNVRVVSWSLVHMTRLFILIYPVSKDIHWYKVVLKVLNRWVKDFIRRNMRNGPYIDGGGFTLCMFTSFTWQLNRVVTFWMTTQFDMFILFNAPTWLFKPSKTFVLFILLSMLPFHLWDNCSSQTQHNWNSNVYYNNLE